MMFESRCSGQVPSKQEMDVLGRSLTVAKAAGRLAWLRFDELFSQSLSSADYLALCSHFDEIYIEGIPQFTWEMRAEARRFVMFLDIIYDLRVLGFALLSMYLHLCRRG